tara:strand:+ start:4296 stop:4568 length:273 start_codon:yes stop_codon:yes gene_type:complete
MSNSYPTNELITSETLTTEEIDKHYSAATDSMVLLNFLLLQKTDHTTEEIDMINNNVKHLEIMVAKDFWGSRDLEGFKDVIIRGNDFLSK